jgi:HAD superfamily hydrolase (TIGR01509 family)
MTPTAVIFDCDGVLVDSEPLMNREFAAMLTEFGLPMTTEQSMATFMGRSMTSCLTIIRERTGRDVPADFLPTLEQRAFAVFERELQPVTGISELLNVLDAEGITYGVASSGEYTKMQKTLGLTGLLPRLHDRLTSAVDVAHGKPAPDVFLLAAERLGVAPEDCLVLEDSALGIQAARAANMTAVGFSALTAEQTLRDAGAHHVVRHPREVMPWVRLAGH